MNAWLGGGTGTEMLKLKPITQLIGPKERARVERKKTEQDYDPDPPRCGTCLFFTLGTWSQRAIEAKKGRGIEHLQRCTFGNFHTTTRAVCDEWRNKDGERIAEGGTEPCGKVENWPSGATAASASKASGSGATSGTPARLGTARTEPPNTQLCPSNEA